MDDSLEHRYYSERNNLTDDLITYTLEDLCELFSKFFSSMWEEGFFVEAFGPLDDYHDNGTVGDVDLEIQLTIRKKDLWPIHNNYHRYNENDLFDMIEFMFQHVSKKIVGTRPQVDSYVKTAGRVEYRNRINRLLRVYGDKYTLSTEGLVLQKEEGLSEIFDAELRTHDSSIRESVAHAARQFRHRGATSHDRRAAVVVLCGVLERLRPAMKDLISSKDESDLFNIANNFQLRHASVTQKSDYDPLWLNWMLYHCLSMIHLILRKQDAENKKS